MPKTPSQRRGCDHQARRRGLKIRTWSGESEVPPGWKVEPISWGGRPAMVAYDPHRIALMRLQPTPSKAAFDAVACGQESVELGQEAEELLDRSAAAGVTATGHLLAATGLWHRVATDSTGAEIWAADRAEIARARLDGLMRGHPGVDPPAAGAG